MLSNWPSCRLTARTWTGPGSLPAAGSVVQRESVQVASPETGVRVVRRTLTNVGQRNMYYSSEAMGFSRHDVTVTPAAVRIAPDERVEIEIRIPARAGSTAPDSGVVQLRGADGTRVRIPVSITR